MSSQLSEVWDATKAVPFNTLVGRDSQLNFGLVLLLSGFMLSSFFALNRDLLHLSVFGLLASLAFGFGSVYVICGLGVYV